jgi:hypothetical protein
MLHAHDTMTRTSHQAAGVASNRRRALRAKATANGHRWDGPNGTYHVAVTEPAAPTTGRVGIEWIADYPALRPAVPTALDAPVMLPTLGGAPDPTALRTVVPVPVESPTWGPMVESCALEILRLRSGYCDLTDPATADHFASVRMLQAECEARADRERAAVRLARRRKATAARVRAHRERAKSGDAAPLTADEWALAHGVVLPDVGTDHSALSVSRENRRAKPSRVPAVDLYGARL